jgi:two-component system, chemotaxis family, protein-glutamate methylesterase/glutaminase
MSSDKVTVLLVDDSAVVRGLLARAIESDPDIRLLGTAMHGQLALNALRKEPADVVVLDVEMPVMDGLTALRHILEEFPRTKVVMASGQTYDGAETTMKALALGAAGCIAKPVTASTSSSIEQVTRELLPLIKALKPSGRRDAVQSNAVRPSAPSVPTAPTPKSRKTPSVLVIGSSTGGPQALRAVLCGLPRDYPLPILITQHMPPLFTPMLAKHLGVDTGRPSHEGAEGMLIERNHTYVAPGDFHMEVTKRDERMAIRVNQAPPEHFCRPSVNPMFRTAAEWYGSGVLAVMLTGMGEDGIEATRTVVDRGGYMIAQDEASSVVWGMPGAVVRAGLAHEVLPVTEIAGAILRRSLLEVAG